MITDAGLFRKKRSTTEGKEHSDSLEKEVFEEAIVDVTSSASTMTSPATLPPLPANTTPAATDVPATEPTIDDLLRLLSIRDDDEEPDYTHLFVNKEYLESDSLDGVFMTPEEMAALSAEGGSNGGFVDLPRDTYCPVLDGMPRACWGRSVLELWKNDLRVVDNLTREEMTESLRGDNDSEAQFGHKGVIKR